jgi:hypothetical protein
MAKNRLVKVLKDKTPHFIAKFYILSSMESEDHGTEYHLYFKGAGKGRWTPSSKEYTNLQYLHLNEEEILHFRAICADKYKTEIVNEHGRIFVHKELGFSKEGIKRVY